MSLGISSCLPLSYEASQAYTIDILRAVLEEEPILGKQWLLDNPRNGLSTLYCATRIIRFYLILGDILFLYYRKSPHKYQQTG